MNAVNFAIADALGRHSDSIAIYSPDGQVVTFGRIAELINSISVKLMSSGVKPGNFVSFVVDNPVIRICGVFALSRIGANAVMTADVSSAQMAGVPLDYAVVLPDQTSDVCRNIVFDQSWVVPTSETVDFVPGGKMISGSSGTTGLPKYMPMPFDIQIERLARYDEIAGECRGAQFLGFGEYSSIGFRFICRALLAGCGTMFRTVSPENTLAEMVRHDVQEINSTPLLISQFVEAIEAGGKAPAISLMMTGGAPISAPLLKRVHDAYNSPILTMIGSTEISTTAGGFYDPETFELGWCGPIAPGVTCRIEDDTGTPLPTGDVGQIALWITPGMRCGKYYSADGPFDEDGWFRSGDLGRMTVDNCLVIVGRTTDLINLGGHKIYPGLIESLALQVSGVTEVAAVGVPNSDGFEDIGLACVASDETVEALLVQTVASSIGERVNFHVRLVDSLIYTAANKLDRKAMRALFT